MMRKIVMATIRSTTDSMFSWRPNTRALAGSYQESTTDPSSITGLDITDLGAWARAANPQQSQNAEGGTASAGSLAFASTDPDIERPARRKGPCGHGTHARHGLCYRAQTNLTPQALWHVRAREPFFEKNYSIGFEVGLRLLSPASKSECNHSDMAAGRLWNKCGDGAAIHINLNWCLALGVCSTLHRHLQHEGGIVAKCRFAHDRRVTLKAAR
jgi:hypothetical protein